MVASRRNERSFVVNRDLKTGGKIACSLSIHPYKRPLGQQIVRLMLAARRVASGWITVTFIAVTWTSELQGSPQAQQRDPVGIRHALAAPNVHTAGDYGFRIAQESSQLVRLGQAATDDQLLKGISREHHRPELLAPPHSIKLQKSMQQERERADRLEQSLAPTKHDLETQMPLVLKASDVITGQKQTAESGAELEESLQQLRERADRLEQALAPAKRELSAQESDEFIRLKQAAKRGAELEKSLQQERERVAQLQQDLATANRKVETQTALAAKTSEEASRLNLAAKGGAELQRSLQQERERATKLQQDLSGGQAGSRDADRASRQNERGG